MAAPAKPVTPGYRTTEFWVTVASGVGWLTAALAGALPARWAAALLAASGIAYKLSRGLAKSG